MFAACFIDNEVDRVVRVQLDPNAKQGELVAALEPVVDRLLKRYAQFRTALPSALQRQDSVAEKAAQDELDALLLFKGDLGGFIRLYTFLSQIIDYGNTDIEKRSIFYRQVLRLLEFGRERDGVDLSKVILTHHALKNQGKRSMPLNEGDKPKLEPITEAGTERIRLRRNQISEKRV